jgi:hypothetical protein
MFPSEVNGGDVAINPPGHHASWVLCPCLFVCLSEKTVLPARAAQNLRSVGAFTMAAHPTFLFNKLP